MFYHDSFDSYVNGRKIGLKRKLLCLSNCLGNWLFFIHSLISVIKSDRDTIRMMGSIMILMTNHYKLMIAMFMAMACFKCIVQLSINLWIVSADLFGLNNANTCKLIRRAQSVYWLVVIYTSLIKLILCIMNIYYSQLGNFIVDQQIAMLMMLAHL